MSFGGTFFDGGFFLTVLVVTTLFADLFAEGGRTVIVAPYRARYGAAMASTACTFCGIANGDLDAAVVLDEPGVLAFLDHSPVFPGHVLVIPRSHHVTLTDLPHELLLPVFAAAQRVAVAVQSALDADGTWVSMNNTVSQSVAHFHIHVVPRRRKDGLRGFYWPRQKYADGALDETAMRIRTVLQR